MDEDLLTKNLILNYIYFILCFIFNIPFYTCTNNFYARFFYNFLIFLKFS